MKSCEIVALVCRKWPKLLLGVPALAIAGALAACSTTLGNGLFQNPNAMIAISGKAKEGGCISAEALKALDAERAYHGSTTSVPSLCHPAELIPGDILDCLLS